MSRTKKILLVIAGLCLAMVVALAIGKAVWDSHFYDGYDASLALEENIESDEELDGYRRVKFSFQGVPGERVPTIMALPKGAKGPLPCLIFLHGIGQKKEFLDEIAQPFVDAGFAFVSFDQYTRGERRLEDSNPLKDLLALRRRAALTVLESRRLVDYLVTREDIDPNRIHLLGGSFGAITGSTAAAFEPRFSAAVLCYGGGNFRVLFDSEGARGEAGMLTTPLAHMLAFVMAPGDPVLYVDRISPRPVLFQGGKHDTIVPPASGQALYDAAKDPKEIIWYDSDHIGLDEGHVWVVLNDAISWIRKVEKERGYEYDITSGAS